MTATNFFCRVLNKARFHAESPARSNLARQFGAAVARCSRTGSAGTGANGSGEKALAAELPGYTLSLLHIKVPISVTLATKRQPIDQIMELGAGSIIHFEKSCEEMLDLYVGEHPVAKGEAVKVGEKFGLRITSVIMPEERFKPVGGTIIAARRLGGEQSNGSDPRRLRLAAHVRLATCQRLGASRRDLPAISLSAAIPAAQARRPRRLPGPLSPHQVLFPQRFGFSFDFRVQNRCQEANRQVKLEFAPLGFAT